MPSERAVVLEWKGEGLKFDGRGSIPTSPGITVDGDSETGPSPMQALLLSAASCAASDVVLILEKMRVGLKRFSVTVTGMRRDVDPRKYISIHFAFQLAGSGLDEAKAERAVALSVEKYCSVIHSLAPDIAISHDIAVA